MEKEKVANRKDLMIYLLKELSKKNNPVRMDKFFFETGYAKGLDSFREVLSEMSKIGWVNLIEKPGGLALGFLPTLDISYTITLKGIEYLENPIKNDSDTKNIINNNINLSGKKNKMIIDQSLSKSKTTNIAAKTEIPIIKKILIGVFIAVIGTIIAWYLTTNVL